MFQTFPSAVSGVAVPRLRSWTHARNLVPPVVYATRCPSGERRGEKKKAFSDAAGCTSPFWSTHTKAIDGREARLIYGDRNSLHIGFMTAE
jgi:hypothetical protein